LAFSYLYDRGGSVVVGAWVR